jgi:hypothetical protein
LRLRRGLSLRDLPYLGLYVPIKSTRIGVTELLRLDTHPARYVFNEHLLCLYFAIRGFDELASDRCDYQDVRHNETEMAAWANRVFFDRLATCGAKLDPSSAEVDGWTSGPAHFFATLRDVLERLWASTELFIRPLGLSTEGLSGYSGPLLSYHGFLLPVLARLRELSFLPKAPVFLLVDDADNLNQSQTEILNSWISTRTTSAVCIKASTQMGYKTRMSLGGQRIETPHDYNEIDVSVLYTTRRDHYLNRLEQIVRKRLAVAGIDLSPREFFPEDAKQEAEVRKIADALRKKWAEGEGRGARASDDATRYARPEFIRLLGGPRKSRSSYSYSGFEQLAHVSSGVVRWFLEPAARMVAAQKSLGPTAPVRFIEPRVQNEQIRQFSEEFYCRELGEMRRDAKAREGDYTRLEFLINVMGRTFKSILVDEKRSERRVFSIALSDRPDEDVQRILDLGVREGYFYRATIGAKDGHGRTARYVLSRRLAPFFTLDPTSFAGYLFVTSDRLRQAMHGRTVLLRDFVAEGEQTGDIQMELPMDEKI